MTNPARITDIVRYDYARGLLVEEPQTASTAGVYTDVEAVVEAFRTTSLPRWALPYLAGYGVALAARAWAARPSDARRGAIIQAGEQLCAAQPDHRAAQQWIALCVEHADAAVLANEDAEAALVAFVDAAAQQADRRAERCGRRAAELIQPDDYALAVGDTSLALAWMFALAAVDKPQFQLAVANDALYTIAHAAGLDTTLLADDAIAAAFADARFGLCVAAAEAAALDGSVAVTGTQEYAAIAQQHRVPLYVLADGGPSVHAATISDAAPRDLIAPDMISAIVTDRGMYRAAMLARYNDDQGAPLDVIPLMGA